MFFREWHPLNHKRVVVKYGIGIGLFKRGEEWLILFWAKFFKVIISTFRIEIYLLLRFWVPQKLGLLE